MLSLMLIACRKHHKEQPFHLVLGRTVPKAIIFSIPFLQFCQHVECCKIVLKEIHHAFVMLKKIMLSSEEIDSDLETRLELDSIVFLMKLYTGIFFAVCLHKHHKEQTFIVFGLSAPKAVLLSILFFSNVGSTYGHLCKVVSDGSRYGS